MDEIVNKGAPGPRSGHLEERLEGRKKDGGWRGVPR